MDVLVSVKLPKMTQPEIDQLLSAQFLCRIAFKEPSAPYVAPFQYVYLDGVMYFHFTGYGKKLGLLEAGNPVCIEVEQYTPDLDSYCFVVLVGKLQVVADAEEKTRALSRMAETAEVKGLSTSFLAAHGFPKDADWFSLNAEPSLIVVKLVDVSEVSGLKSP
jgi:nitroimidazol reductase NimA-like FMN-containing flavoprotein (pyridoxamine 5'-phosphate oxidase superfamily)